MWDLQEVCFTLTRPKQCFDVNKLKYLKRAFHCGLIFHPTIPHQPLDIRVFYDVDWATESDDKRSTSEAAIYLDLIQFHGGQENKLWFQDLAQKLSIVVQQLLQLTLWIQTLLKELQFLFILLCENLSAVNLAHNPLLHVRTKHMELHVLFVHTKKVSNKQIVVQHIPGQDKWADLLKAFISYQIFLS